MPSDAKPVHVSLGAGMDQGLDEYSAAQPGNIRRAINVRSRMGGSAEQRRGVHGFALTVPSYMARFQATGVVEFVGGDRLGTRGNAFHFNRDKARAFYAGRYSEYLPVRRTTAYLSETQHGRQGQRHVVAARDTLGNQYLVIASTDGTTTDIRVLDSGGTTVGSISVAGGGLALALAPRDGDGTVKVYYDSGSNRLNLLVVTLGPDISFSDPVQLAFVAGGAVASIPTGTWPTSSISTRHPDSMYILRGDPLSVSYREGSGVSYSAGVGTAIPSGLTNSLFALAHGRKRDSYHIVAYTEKNVDKTPTGSIRYVVMSHYNATLNDSDQVPKPVATGILVQQVSGGKPYSAPIIGSTERSDKFIWAASNGRTTFGTLTIASGTVQVNSDTSIEGVPMSQFDDHGAIWMMDDPGLLYDVGLTPPVDRASRAFLLKYPVPINLGDGGQSPLVQLVTGRQFPNPVSRRDLTWSPDQSSYSQIANTGKSYHVMLPLQLRSQQTGLYSIEKYEYQHSDQTEHRPAIGLGRSTIVAGQPVEIYPNPNRVGAYNATSPTGYDARQSQASELGFPKEPYIATLASASGANIQPGNRLYTALFEWLSPSGERHRSRPATPRTITNSAPIGVALTIPNEFLSQRFPPPVVHYYRTVDGRKEFRRISPDAGAPSGTFYDHVSDDDLRDNEVLYTAGGVQPNDLPPSCRFVALGEDRLWLGGLFERDIIQASKKFVPREPVQFSDLDSFKVRLPFDNTGLAYLDGALIAFCSGSCYLVTGDGPNAQGSGGFTLRPIANNAGCIDSRSIVVTSQGVFFQSRRGLQLMPRGFGSPELIRNLNDVMGEHGDGFTEIIGATTREYTDEDTVRFLLRNPQTNARIVAVLELGTMTWSYDVLKDASGNQIPLNAIGDGPEGVVYGAGSGTHKFLVELEGAAGTPYDSMGSTVNRFWSEVHLGRFQPFGPAGDGKFRAAQLRGYAPATGAEVYLSVVRDFATRTHLYSGIGSGTWFRRATAGEEDMTASEGQVSAVFRTGVGRTHGLRLLSLTLELEPGQGTRRPRDGEQD